MKAQGGNERGRDVNKGLTLYSAVVSNSYHLIVHCHPGLTYIFNFRHSGTLALSPERQSARMSEIKNVR